MHNVDHIIYNKIICMILQGDKVRTECVDDDGIIDKQKNRTES